MIVNKELSSHARAALEELEKCTSCGLCKDVCPVFALTQREAESPRGKVNLLRAIVNEEVKPSREGVDIFNRCLLCYACQDACPAGVQTERIWIAGRDLLAGEVGLPLTKSLFFRQILPDKKKWQLVLEFGKRFPGDDNSVKIGQKILPRPHDNRIDQLLPELLESRTELRGRVAFFPGCLLTEVFPYIGIKAAEILATLGYEVITPRERVCCGAPAFNNGDMNTGRDLGEINLEVFGELEVDYIISPDATCGGAFRHEYEILFPEDSRKRNDYLKVREKVRDFGEFILTALEDNRIVELRPISRHVTVHDSCHLSHLQHKSDIPRKLLTMIPDLELIDGKRNELCCGFGGSYSIYFPSESKAIARRKLKDLGAVQGNLIAVGSPGCLWKLRSEAVDRSLSVDIRHYLELLWDSLIGNSTSVEPGNNNKG